MGRYLSTSLSGGSRTLRLFFKLRHLLLRMQRNYCHLEQIYKSSGTDLLLRMQRNYCHLEQIYKSSGTDLLLHMQRNYCHLEQIYKSSGTDLLQQMEQISQISKTTGLQSCCPPSYRRTIPHHTALIGCDKTTWLHHTALIGCDKTSWLHHRSASGSASEVKRVQSVRFYTTSKRDPLEASSTSRDPQTSSSRDPQTSSSRDPQTSSSRDPQALGARLGQTLDRLSRDLHVCFMRRDASWVVCMAGGGGDDDGGGGDDDGGGGGGEGVVAAPEYLSRRGQRERETLRQRERETLRQREIETLRQREIETLGQRERETLGQRERERQRERETQREDRQRGQDSETWRHEREQDSSSSPPVSSAPLQLFHISSLASSWGESFSYVSNHINSVFSRDPPGPEDVLPETGITPVTMATHAGQRRRKAPRRKVQRVGPPGAPDAQRVGPPDPVVQSSSSWEDSYQYLSGHINRYFGAKATDEYDPQPLPQKEKSGADPEASKASSSRTLRVPPSQPKLNREPRQEEPPSRCSSPSQPRLEEELVVAPQTTGLFHSSSYAARFGESYAQMAAHVNRYFKGRGSPEEEWDGNDLGGMVPAAAAATAAAVEDMKPVSFLDCLLQPSTSIPSLLAGLLNLAPPSGVPADTTASSSETRLKRRVALGMRQAELITHGLIDSVGGAFSPDELTAHLEALNQHLLHYPACRALLWQDRTAVKLLKHRRRHKDNQEVQEVIRESLALIGYVDPVRGRGIRVLSIDGGGTRGVVPLQVLKLLEEETGRPIHQLFDYICGVSTGAVLGFMVGVARFSLDQCGQMYRRFGSDVFRQNALVGTVNMGWSHSYYSTDTWEAILRETLGEKLLLSTVREELSPKVSAVSAVVNWGTSPKPFVFRNYNHIPGSLSRYPGGSHYKMWEAVRASSAAPGYFQEFCLQSDIHQDGGILLNNPCALAVHEARLLWPKQPFQCVVSLGTGRYDNTKRNPASSTSLRAKLSTLVYSATDTEGVHTLLDDLLAPDVYFRFNPMLSSQVSLDESRASALDGLLGETGSYLERNKDKLQRLCLVLGAKRSAVQNTQDWMRGRAWEAQQRWF